MIAIRRGIALSMICAAAPAALLLSSAPASAKHGTRDVEAGPLWNQMDADRKCPRVARDAGGTWTGQWHTTIPGQMSVCEVAGAHEGRGWIDIHKGHKVKSVEVGPIWNQMDAERKCTAAARERGGTWNGQWRTTVPGRMSECDIRR
jgi:hypothetical protein